MLEYGNPMLEKRRRRTPMIKRRASKPLTISFTFPFICGRHRMKTRSYILVTIFAIIIINRIVMIDITAEINGVIM